MAFVIELPAPPGMAVPVPGVRTADHPARIESVSRSFTRVPGYDAAEAPAPATARDDRDANR